MTERDSYLNFFRAMPLPAAILRPVSSGFEIADVNESFTGLLGKSRGDLVGQGLKESAETKENTDHKCLISERSVSRAFSSGNKETKEWQRSDSGSSTGDPVKKWYSTESIPIFGEQDQVEFVLYTVEDITARILTKQNEEKIRQELLEQQQQFLHFIEKNPDGFYSLDLNGNFTSANEGLLKLAETSLGEILSMNFLPFCAPNDRAYVQKCFNKAINGGSISFEAEFVSTKGQRLVLQISLMPLRSKGKIAGVYGIAKDITGVRRSQKAFSEKKKFLEVNASFIKSLMANNLQNKAIEEAFSIIGRTVAVDRMYYFGSKSDSTTEEVILSQKIEWTSETASSQIANPEMQNLPAKRVEQIMGPLSENSPFTATLSELPENDLKEIFLDQDIKSLLLLPIFLQNQLHGFIGFDDCRSERKWSTDEITFLQSLAHYFTNALEKRTAERVVKEQEEQLRKSEQKFRALVQEGSDLIAILDIKGNYSFISETSNSVLGISPETYIGRNAFDFIHPEDLENVQQEFRKLEHQKQVKVSAFRFSDNEGNWKWLETIATDMRNDQAVKGIITNSRDVTTLIEQAREIENINERYHLAATATNDLIYDWDLENNQVQRFHRSLEDLFGFPVQEIDKNGFWVKNIHPDDVQKTQQKLESILANPEENYIRTDYRLRRADGSYANVVDKGYIIRNSSGKAIRLVGATSDISEMTAKEMALKIANKRFKMAMKATNEIIWDWDIASDYVNRSKIFGKLYGYGSNEKPAMHSFWVTKIDPRDRDRVTRSLTSALKSGNKKKWKEEYRFLKADGEIAYVIDRGYIIRDEEGKAFRMIGAVLDVTESRKLLREIKKQNKVLKEIAWEQSHIVRAPLARLKGLLSLLQGEEFCEWSQEEILTNIYLSADELDGILKDIVNRTESIVKKGDK